jgi:hypothetical protein
MYYLKPKRDTVFPLIVLLGDIHEYRTGECKSCECKLSEENEQGGDSKQGECCLRTSQPEWLKALDRLAKDVPVDFHTEFSPYHTGGQDNNILFRDFYDLTWVCHQKNKRSKRDYRHCPTQNIRWHYVDIRFIVHTIEGSLFNPYHYYLYSLVHVYNKYVKRVEHTPSRYSSSQINEFVSYYIESKREDMYCVSEKCDLIDPLTKGSPFLQQLLSIICALDQTVEQMTHTIFDTYWEILQREETTEWKSMILKQIRKIPMAPFNDPSFWKELMVERLLHDPIYLRSAEAWIQALSSLEQKDHAFLSTFFVRLADSTLPSQDYDYVMDRMEWLMKHVKLLDSFLIFLNVKVMDVYHLARMIKPPQDNDPGALSFGFFGDFHTRSIVEMLQHPAFGYQVKTIQAPEPELFEYKDPRWDRCVKVSEPVPLVQDVQEHVRGRNYSRYQAILAKEAENRNVNRLQYEAKPKPKMSGMNLFQGMFGGKGKGRGTRGRGRGRGTKGRGRRTRRKNL